MFNNVFRLTVQVDAVVRTVSSVMSGCFRWQVRQFLLLDKSDLFWFWWNCVPIWEWISIRKVAGGAGRRCASRSHNWRHRTYGARLDAKWAMTTWCFFVDQRLHLAPEHPWQAVAHLLRNLLTPTTTTFQRRSVDALCGCLRSRVYRQIAHPLLSCNWSPTSMAVRATCSGNQMIDVDQAYYLAFL